MAVESWQRMKIWVMWRLLMAAGGETGGWPRGGYEVSRRGVVAIEG